MEQRLVQKKQIVDFFLKKDILLSSDVLENLNEKNIEQVSQLITDKILCDVLICKHNEFKVLGVKDLILKILGVKDLIWFN